MDEFKKPEFKEMVFAVLLIVGIGIGVYLVQQTQVFKPRAASDINSVVNVKDSDGNNVPFSDGAYQLNAPGEVTIRLNNPDESSDNTKNKKSPPTFIRR